MIGLARKEATMTERAIKQARFSSDGFLIGVVCEDGTAWVRGWSGDSGYVWTRIPGPPDEPPDPDERIPASVTVEIIAFHTVPPTYGVRMVSAGYTWSRGEARAVARALLEAAG